MHAKTDWQQGKLTMEIQKSYLHWYQSVAFNLVNYSVIWPFGEISVMLYRDGRQMFESSQEAHERG
jgi:hypothetical protein